MTGVASEGARLRELYDLNSEGNAAWGGAYDGDLHGAFARLRETGPVHEGTVAELVGRPTATMADDRPSFSCFSWETVWTDPDAYDLRRPMVPHSGFAGGPHVCLGMHVARAEMGAALSAVLDRLPGVRLDDTAPPVRIVGQEHRGVTALPVVFG